MSISEPKPSTVEPDERFDPASLPDRNVAEIVEFEEKRNRNIRRALTYPFRHPVASGLWVIRTGFGILSLILLLSLIAAVPVVNFLALGYLLEVEGRLARSGRFRDAFPLLEIAPRLGAIALGIWLFLLPLRLLSDAAADARVIDSGSKAATILTVVTALAAIVIAAHLLLALARGGSFSCFFRPIKNLRLFIERLEAGTLVADADRNVREFVGKMQLRHHFWLGLRGYLGALIWLLPPTVLLAIASTTEPGAKFVTIIGGLCLIPVFAWLPFLQARFASQNRFRAFWELGKVRQLIAKAPIAWLLAVTFIYVLALPLYLFKIVAPPRDALWFITPVFIVSIYPAKALAGWAYHRAVSRPHKASWPFRWGSRLAVAALLVIYVFLLYLTPAISEHGKLVLFEHHAYLLPVPF